MKNTYSLEQLKEMANNVFADYPNAKKVYATADGNVFLEENRAKLHAGTAGTVYPIDRPEAAPAGDNASEGNEPAKEPGMNATDTIKAIAACNSLDELKKFEGDERKTVAAAYELRKKVLEVGTGAPAADDTNTGNGTNTEQ